MEYHRTCDSEHGPDDEQADARGHEAARRQGCAGDAAAAPPAGGQFNGKHFLTFYFGTRFDSIPILSVTRIFSIELAP